MVESSRGPKFDKRIDELVAAGPVNAETLLQTTAELGVTVRAVKAAVLRAGGMLDASTSLVHHDDSSQDTSDEGMTSAEQTIELTDNQFGVLQGAANVAAGCTTAWGVILVIVCVVLLVILVKEII